MDSTLPSTPDRNIPPGPKVDPTIPTVPTTIEPGFAASHVGLGKRIRSALATLSLNSPPQARAILDGYFRFLGKNQYHVDFPRTLRPMPNNPEASAECGGHLLLYFHVGSAIYAYQCNGRLLAMKNNTKTHGEALAASRALLLSRVEHLEALTTPPLCIVGSSDKGWRLEPKKKGAENVPDQNPEK